MIRLMCWILSILIAGAMLSTPANAAKAGAVMVACDHVAAAGGSCSYSVNDHGDVEGCAQAKGSATKSCFVCASGQNCVGTTESNSRKPGKGTVTTIGGVKLPPAPPKGGHPVSVGGIRPPNSAGTKQSGSGNQTVTIERTNNMQHSGSGGGGKK